jgi:hypothetical protein
VRYYRIEISDPSSGKVVTPPGFDGLLGGATYTSFVNGQTLPGAWNVELDIPVIGAATPQGSALARVWGISQQEISQANDLKGKNIKIFGGMQKGLPLANPAQSGLLVQGYVFQAFGNWIGVDRTLDLVINPGQATASVPGGLGTLAAPKNIVLNWKAGTPLAGALQSTLSTAFPGSTVTVNIDAGIVRPNDEVGYFPTLEELAQYVTRTSRDIIKTKNYRGVTIVPAQNAFSIFDGSGAAGAQKKIEFQDLIGQPTWIEAPNISIKTVMRADISVGDDVSLPQAVTTNTAAAQTSQVNQAVAFQGGFQIVSERHVGNFRQATADAWVTVYEGAPLNQAAA